MKPLTHPMWRWTAVPVDAEHQHIRIRGTGLGQRFKVANVLGPGYDNAPEWEHEETRAVAALVLLAPDHALVARAMTAGVARWRQFYGDCNAGELCVGGMCYCTHLDAFGVPLLTTNTRDAIARLLP